MLVRKFLQEAGLVKNGMDIGCIQISGKWLTEKKQRFIIEKDEKVGFMAKG